MRRDSYDREMARRAAAARHAVREGVDPYLALLLVVCPPKTPEDARDLLRVKAA